MSNEPFSTDDPRLTAYILDELSPSERAGFEAELAGNPQLQAELREMQQAAAQVFAALQSEPEIGLTARQVETVRTAAAGEPVPPAPPRVTLARTRGSFSVRPSIAAPAVVLAGLVLVTAALILSARFPQPELADRPGDRLSELTLADNNAYGVLDEQAGTIHPVSNGPVLAYDNLRQRYRIEFANGGLIESHYVTLLAADAVEGHRELAESELNEDILALRDLEREGRVPDASVTFETNGALVVSDTNRNGRFDDDALMYKAIGEQAPVTGPTPPVEDVPEWIKTGNGNVDRAAEAGFPAVQLGTTAAPEPASTTEGGDKAFSYFVVPMDSLSTLPVQSGAQQQSNPGGVNADGQGQAAETVPPGNRYYDLYFATPPEPASEAAPAASGLMVDLDVNGQGDAGGMGGFPGGQPSDESLRRLSVPRGGSVRFSRARRYDFTNPGESGQQDGGTASANSEATGAFRVNRDQLLTEEAAAQKRVDQIQAGQTSRLERFGDRSGNGQPLPAEHREALREALKQYEATASQNDGLIREQESDVRALQTEKESQNAAYGWAARSIPWDDGHWKLNWRNDGQWGYTPGTEAYAPIVENDFRPTLAEPVSTFSIDVDTGSYANCRRFINSGTWPPADAVRVEELVNAFTYHDPAPAGEQPIAVNFDVAACPWQPEQRLVRIGLKARDIVRADRPPTRLVFLIDTSGSMSADNKLPLVRQSLHLLVDELSENDRVAMVTYATEAGVRLDSTLGEDRPTILAAVDALQANGSTNGEGGLRLAYDVAERQFSKEASNRVILCTDGDFNVGESEDSELVKLIEEKRKSRVFLSVFGFGTGNLKDAKLEQIADHGNGQYGYVDSLDEAKNVFVHDLAGTLYTVAKDVKLQVDFNPTQVASYRLIGYENRALENADFDNDVVDAGDVGAGHSVTALYQVAPRDRSDGSKADDLAQAALDRFVRLSRNMDDNVQIDRDGTVLNINGQVVSEERKESAARYVTALLAKPEFENLQVHNNLEVVKSEELPPAGNDLLKLRVRYKLPDEDESRLFESTLVDDGAQQSPSADFQWSAAVAAYGLLLRQSRFRGNATFDAIIETAEAAKGDDPHGRRREFIDLVRQSRALYVRQTGQSQPEPVELTSVEARERATCNAKYSNLLDKLEVPEDLKTYGAFRDYGYWAGDAYRNFTGLPTGYWVYVYPHWYIWGEESTSNRTESIDGVR